MADLLSIVDVLGRSEAPPPLIAPDPPRKQPQAPRKGAAAAGAEATKAGAANPCQSVTLKAVRDVGGAIENALAKAREDETLNGENGGYPAATKGSVTHFIVANDRADQLIKFLESYERQFFDQNGFMINTSATYTVYGNLRDIVMQLHLGRHWSAVSCAHNSHFLTPPRNNEHAVACIDAATTAIELAEPLSANATKCYVRTYI